MTLSYSTNESIIRLLVGLLFFSTTCFVDEVAAFSATKMPGTGKTTVIAGASGYIGKSVVRESVRQGYNTIALVRDKEKITSKEGEALYGQFFDGANVVECDVTNPDQLTKVCIFKLNKTIRGDKIVYGIVSKDYLLFDLIKSFLMILICFALFCIVFLVNEGFRNDQITGRE